VNIHEEKFISSFVLKEKRGRYFELLPSEKHRWKITSRFDHPDDLNTDLATQIPPSQQRPDAVLIILKGAGAGEFCWIISDSPDIDGTQMRLADAIHDHLYREGTFFSCVPGKLVLYSGEDINDIQLFKS
jgi:hypothetical protein